MDIFYLPLLDINQHYHYGGPEQNTKRKNKTFTKLKKKDITPDNLKLIEKIYSKDINLYKNVNENGILINKNVHKSVGKLSNKDTRPILIWGKNGPITK